MANSFLDDMKKLRSWCLWIPVPRENGGVGKPPHTAYDDTLYPLSIVKELSTDDRKGLRDYKDLVKFLKGEHPLKNNFLPSMKKATAGGLSFVFTKDNDLVGLDLDNCFHEGKLNQNAKRIVDFFDTYTETSPSGNGIHMYIHVAGLDKTKLTQGQRKNDVVELFFYNSALTVTGKGEKPIRTISLDDFESWLEMNSLSVSSANKGEAKKPMNANWVQKDEDLLPADMAFTFLLNQKNGVARDIFNGDFSKWEDNHSKATMALLDKIVWMNVQDIREVYEMFTILSDYERKKHANYDSWLNDCIEHAKAFVLARREGLNKWRRRNNRR